VEVSINGSLIAYQGTAGSNTLETIDFTKGWVDPRDGTYFSYYLTKDRKHYQLLWFLEEESSITSQNNSVIPSPGRGGLGRGVAQAVSYDNRIPTVYGRKLWILTNDQNTPIEQAWADVDITTSNTTNYIAHLDSITSVESTWLDLVQWIFATSVWKNRSDCESILKSNDDILWVDWEYWITSDWETLKVYCDMTREWWWWTLVWHGYPTQAENMLTEYEKVNIVPWIEFNNMMISWVKLDYYDTDVTSETAKLTQTIPYYFNYVWSLPDTPNPSVLFHDPSGIQNVSLVWNKFFYWYSNSWRIFHWCVNVAGPLYMHLPSCTSRPSFLSGEVWCTWGGDNYCNWGAMNNIQKDSGLWLSLREYQETQVFIK
jgi:hypothetical protein